ncbi:glycosyl hydrolase family 8 [Paenibacillus tuaregi]|uniref:glycosyl hydrolase family 8 n=1 Tax=Paenibacillus tuaregi TaxID=1816681 RepID=UPI000837DA84|nr:glycosyl hydrolase family 8 [Paenibacillus tuaregi]
MKKYWTGGLSAVLLLNVLMACGNAPAQTALPKPPEQQNKSEKAVPDHTSRFSDQLGLQPHREETERFIMSKMYGPYGVYTNYQDSGESDTAATGHEVLSESAGLLMRYDVLMNRKDAFQTEWERAKQVFELASGFSYRYSPKQDKKYTINAAVDDLRMIRALYDAGEKFHSAAYTELADTYGKRFSSYNIKGGKLYDFYDDTYKVTNDFVTLCYIDLTTLKRLPIPSTEKETLISSMQKIIEQGYLSDEFPFYETRYHYSTDTYRSEGINTVESLLTILSLSEAGLQKPASIAYLKQQVKAGTLYGKYDKKGRPQNQIQSTAIYAITALIGSALKDADLYGDSIKQMEKYRVTDKDSPLYGGYGDAAANQAFSFDNLMALLAYAH